MTPIVVHLQLLRMQARQDRHISPGCIPTPPPPQGFWDCVAQFCRPMRIHPPFCGCVPFCFCAQPVKDCCFGAWMPESFSSTANAAKHGLVFHAACVPVLGVPWRGPKYIIWGTKGPVRPTMPGTSRCLAIKLTMASPSGISHHLSSQDNEEIKVQAKATTQHPSRGGGGGHRLRCDPPTSHRSKRGGGF